MALAEAGVPATAATRKNVAWARSEIVWTGVTMATLVVATLAFRVPLLAPRLAHWDAVNYALGLHTFDVAAHQPHPPGSPYFILLGRAALALVGDDNAALQLVALVASVGAVVAEYSLGRLLYGRVAAALTALVLMTQPIFWGYGTTATAWTLLAALSISIGGVCLLLLRGHTRLVYPSALLLGIASGFRADATLFLAPLWLWSMSRATRSWRRRTIAVGLVGVCGLAWLVPVAASAGGALDWWQRLLALLPANDATQTARQLAANTAIAFGTLGFTLGPLVLLACLVSPRRWVDWLRATFRSQMGIYWAVWIVPAFTFLWLIDSTEPGHTLVYAGALAALGSGLLVHAARTSARTVVCAAVLVAAQVGVFLFAPPVVDRPLAWTLDSMLLNMTRLGLTEQQTSLDSTPRTIRAEFDPRQTEVVTLVGQDAYRFMMYYLPEYKVLRLDPQGHSALAAYGRQQGAWTPVEGCLLSDAEYGLWVLMAPYEPGSVPDGAQRLTPVAERGPFEVWAVTPTATPVDYLGFTLCTR
jgi:Dolichyl-phosphate-mannose-protein mannosyltransferase